MNNDVNNNPFNFKPNTSPKQPSAAASASAPVSEPVPAPANAVEPVTQTVEPPKPEPAPEIKTTNQPAEEPVTAPNTSSAPMPSQEPAPLETSSSPSIPEVPVAPTPPAIEPAPADTPSVNPVPEPAQSINEAPEPVPSEVPNTQPEPAPVPETEAPSAQPESASTPETVAPIDPMVNKIAESEGKLDQPEQTPQNNIPNPSSPEVMFRNEKQQMEIEAQRQEQQDQNPKPDFNKNELTRLFVGKNYDKVMTNRINFSALFLGPAYFFYRKLAIYGLGAILVQALTNIILIAILPKFLSYTISLGVSILWGVLFNKLYIRYVNNSVDEIIKKSNSMDEAKKLCINDGGTNVGYVLLSIAVSVIIAACIFALFPALMVAVLGNTFTP